MILSFVPPSLEMADGRVDLALRVAGDANECVSLGLAKVHARTVDGQHLAANGEGRPQNVDYALRANGRGADLGEGLGHPGRGVPTANAAGQAAGRVLEFPALKRSHSC